MGRTARIAWLGALACLAAVGPARAETPTRLLSQLGDARVVALEPGAPRAPGASREPAGGARTRIELGTGQPWRRVTPERAAALSPPAGFSVWRLDVAVPTADPESVGVELGAAPLPRWKRGVAPPGPAFAYYRGGFIPGGLYVAMPEGQEPLGRALAVGYQPSAVERAQQVLDAGRRVAPTSLATLATAASTTRPALFVPRGWAVELDLAPPAGARLRLGVAREPGLRTARAAASALRVGVRDGARTEWLAQPRFSRATDPAEPWRDLELDLARFAGRRVTLRFEVSSDGAELLPHHFVSDPELVPGRRERGRTNLVLVVVDGLRADRVLGPGALELPALARLAREGLVFEQARSAAPWTRASVASLFTGGLPSAHGVETEEAQAVLPAGLPTLASALRGAGYATAAFSANLHLHPSFGLARGFASARVDYEDGARLNEAFERWLAADPVEPFFAFVFYMDTHYAWSHRPEYDLSSGIAAPVRSVAELGEGRTRRARGVPEPTPEEVRKLRALYDENVRYADARLGDLVAALERRGLLDRTLVVVTADHGEAFGEHGDFFHGHDLYEELVRVPLVARGPGLARGERRAEPVSLVDLPGALLRWLAAPGAGRLGGRDLRRPCREDGAPCPSYFETRFRGANQAGMVDGSEKVIWDRGTERVALFDLARDPAEREDLAAARPERARAQADALRSALAAARSARPATTGRSAPAIDASTAEALRALGYAD